MKYALKNLKSFFIHKKAVFFLLICTVLLSCIMLEFSYGIFENYRIKKLSQLDFQTNLDIDILEKGKGEDYFTKEMLEQCFADFSKELNRKLEGIILVADGDEKEQVYCYFSLKEGRATVHKAVKKNFMQNNLATDYFSEMQEEQGEKVGLFPLDENGNPLQNIFILEQGAFQFQGEKYQVIGYQKIDGIPVVPFASLKGETRLDESEDISMSFSEALTIQDYQELKNSFQSNAEGYIKVPEMRFSEKDNGLYNTMKLVSVFISVIAAINFAMLFHYMLQEYCKSFRVCRICGMSKWQMGINFMVECIIISVPAFFIGTIIYHFGIYQRLLIKIFPYMWGVYSFKKYIFLFGTYFLFIIFISGGMIKKFVAGQRLVGK